MSDKVVVVTSGPQGIQGPQGPPGVSPVAADIKKGDGTTINRVVGINGVALKTASGGTPADLAAPAPGGSWRANQAGDGLIPDALGQVEVSLDHYGGKADSPLDGTGTDNAPAFLAAMAALGANGGTIRLSATRGKGYRVASCVEFDRPVRIVGHGSSLFAAQTIVVADQNVTPFRVTQASQGTIFDDVQIVSAGRSATTATANYTADNTTVPIDAAHDFANGQLISIEGAGRQVLLSETTADTTNGSATVTLASTGDQTPVIRAGQYLKIGTAYPNPTKVNSVVGTTLTMASNAAATLTASPVRFCANHITRIVSGGGTTTLTVDTADMAGASLASAVVKHADAAIDVLGLVQCHRVCVGDSAGHQFNGAGFCVRGDHSNSPVTNANLSRFSGCTSYANRHALYALGADSNAMSINIYSIQSTEWSFCDLSFLGNEYSGCHADGGQGYLSHDTAANQSHYSGCYQEGGTFSSLGLGSIVSGGTMPQRCGGYSVAVEAPRITAPYYGSGITGDTTFTAMSGEFYADAIEFTGSLSATAHVYFPPSQQFRNPKVIKNATTGGHNIVVACTGGSGVTIPPGYAQVVVADGSANIRKAAPLVRVLNSLEYLIAEEPRLSKTWNNTTERRRITRTTTTTATANQVIEDGLYGEDGAQDFTLQDDAITRIEIVALVKKSGAAEGGSIEVKADYARSGGGAPTLLGSATITYNLVGASLDATTADLAVSGNTVRLRVSPESADTLAWTVTRTHRDTAGP